VCPALRFYQGKIFVSAHCEAPGAGGGGVACVFGGGVMDVLMTRVLSGT
jgi:hypothetical protein